MPVLAKVVGDEARGKFWKKLAGRINQEINRRLWAQKKGVYLDSLYEYIP
ncbi:MAG: hypothetical protein NC911_08520 [Candidatus Omnitrophica bacterium]|nr:hypothetical protein [Candidatus Omnitrophota bacterium]